MNARLAKADDVSHSVVIHICKLPWGSMIAGPTPSSGSKFRKLKGKWRKVTTPDGKRNIDAPGPKADDVGHSVVVHFGEFAWVIVIIAPTSSAGCKFRKLKSKWRKVTTSCGK